MESKYQIRLEKDEEKIAQLLTRDAWGYFSSLISNRELFHVKQIPMMPRQGELVLPTDEELVQYYLDYASAYTEELALLGWEAERACCAANGFALKLESISGQIRGRDRKVAEKLAG